MSPAFDDPSRVSFTGHTFSYNFNALNVNQGDFVRLDITTAPSAVPEPSTFLLFGPGFAGLLGYGWRQRSRRCLQ